MDETIIAPFPVKRISEVQAKKSLRSANEDRSYGNGAVSKYIVVASDIMDLFAEYIEQQMKVAPKGGRGSRIQPDHIEKYGGRFFKAMTNFMKEEKKGDEKE